MTYLYDSKVFQTLISDVFLKRNEMLILEKLLLLSVPFCNDRNYFNEFVDIIGFDGFKWLVNISYMFSGKYRTRLHKLMLDIFNDMLSYRCDPIYLEIFFNFFYNVIENHASLVFRCFKNIKNFYSKDIMKYIDYDLNWNLYLKILVESNGIDSYANGYCGLALLLKYNLVQLDREDILRIMMLAIDNRGVFLGEVGLECLYYYLKYDDYSADHTRVSVVLDLSANFTFFSSLLDNSSFRTIIYLGKIFVFLINSSFDLSQYTIFNNVVVFRILTDIMHVSIQKFQLSSLECLDKLYSRFYFMNSLDQYYRLVNEVSLEEILVELSTSNFEIVADKASCLRSKIFGK